MAWTIYFNPKCATCRHALEILNENGIEPRIVDYLKTPPTVVELDSLFGKLGMAPEFAVRTNEPVYEELGLDQGKLSRAEWLKIIAANPVLLQRPIVVKDNQAIIARPADRLRALL